MSYFDEARAIDQIIKMRKLTQSEIARSMGVSQSYVANKLRLLNFPKSIESRILETNLTERHARALLRLDDEEKIMTAIGKIIDMRLNVAESEVLIDTMLPEKQRRTDYNLKSVSEIRSELERDISSSLAAIRRLGKTATKNVSTYKNKSYITICLED